VGQAIRAAFLAPDLVEALLQGRSPTQLNLAQLTKDLPRDLSEQRRRLGPVPVMNDSLSVRDRAAPSG